MTTPDNDATNADEAVLSHSTAKIETARIEAEAGETIGSETDAQPGKRGLLYFLSLLVSPLFVLGILSRAKKAETLSAREQAVDEAKEILGVVLVAVALVLILRTVLFQPFTIPSASMEPNLYEGDYIIVSKWNYGISKYSLPLPLPIIKGRLFNTLPKRGDVVVFKLPSDNKTDYIKRVVGLPGDRIQMKHDQLYINDTAVPNSVVGPVAAADAKYINGGDTATELSESLPDGRTHLMQDMVKDGPVDDTDVYVVPADHYFMMGDNRDNSEDSRFPMVTGGVDYVPAENLEGRAVLVLMSWKEGASLWKPWTWLNFHWDRFFKSLK